MATSRFNQVLVVILNSVPISLNFFFLSAFIMIPVLGKVESVFVSYFRPLEEGDRSKRRGAASVYVSTEDPRPEWVESLREEVPRITVKVDGSCVRIIDGTLYKRRDIRRGKTPPSNAVFEPEVSGDVCWLPLSMDMEDACFRSTLASENTFWSLNEHGDPIQMRMEDGTYEIIGPKIQGNPYDIPVLDCDLMVQRKGNLKSIIFPRHYLIQHGSIVVHGLSSTEEMNYASLKDFILRNGIEGLVFHFPSGKLFKINRGHLDAHAPGQKYRWYPGKPKSSSMQEDEDEMGK
jgi:hypothetical protein